MVNNTIKPSSILEYILHKGGFVSKFHREALHEVHRSWWDRDVQVGLLTIFGEGKRCWNTFRDATTTTRSNNPIVPEKLTIGKYTYKMPKLLKRYNTIMQSVKINQNIEHHFEIIRTKLDRIESLERELQ